MSESSDDEPVPGAWCLAAVRTGVERLRGRGAPNLPVGDREVCKLQCSCDSAEEQILAYEHVCSDRLCQALLH